MHDGPDHNDLDHITNLKRKGTLQWIPKERLHAHPLNPRIDRNQVALDAIAMTFEREGFPERYAPVVRPIKGCPGDFEVIEGDGRRMVAMGLDAITLVPCWVVEMTDEEAVEWLIRGNVHDAPTLLEIAVGSLAMIPDEGSKGAMTLTEFAKRVGLQQTNLSHYRQGAKVYLRLRDGRHLPAELLRGCRDKAGQLAEIHRAPSESWARLVAQCLGEGWTVARVKAEVDTVNGTVRPAPVSKPRKADAANGNAKPETPATPKVRADRDSAGSKQMVVGVDVVPNNIVGATETGDTVDDERTTPVGTGAKRVTAINIDPTTTVGDQAIEPVAAVLALANTLSSEDKVAVIAAIYNSLEVTAQGAARERVGAVAVTTLEPPIGTPEPESEVVVDSTGPASGPTVRTAPRKPLAKAKSSVNEVDQDALRARLTDAMESGTVAPKDLVAAGIFRFAEYARTFRKEGRQIKPEQAKALAEFLDSVAPPTRGSVTKRNKKQQKGA